MNRDNDTEEDNEMTKEEIADRINELYAMDEELGHIFIEMALEDREDNGLPAPTDEELRQMQRECDENLAKSKAYTDEIESLISEYYAEHGESPVVYCSGTNRVRVRF